MSVSTLADALSDPGVDALAGAAQGFAQAAMPQRMPTPWGAVLGMGAGGALQGVKTSQALQTGQQQLDAAKMQNQMTRMYLGAIPGVLPSASGSPTSSASPNVTPSPQTSTVSPGGINGQYLVPPDRFVSLGNLALMRGDPAAAAKMFEMSQSPATAGYAMSPSGTAFTVPGSKEDPASIFAREAAQKWAGVAPAIAQAGGIKGAEAPYAPPITIDRPILDANGNVTGTTKVQVPVSQWAAGPGRGVGGQLAPTGSPQTTTTPQAASVGALSSLPDDATRQLATNAALRAGLPVDAWAPWMATVHGESQWNLKAPDNKNSNGTYDVGPGQVNSSNFGKYGLTDQTARDPATNLTTSARIFNEQWQASHDPARAMAGYNTGSVSGAPPSYAPAALNRLAQWGYPGTAPSIATTPTGPMPPVSPPPTGMGGDVTLTPMAKANLDAQTAGNKAAMTAPYEPPVTFQVQAPDGRSSYEVTVPRASLPQVGPGAPALNMNNLPPGATIGKQTLTPQAEADLKVRTARLMPYDLRQAGMHVDPSTQDVVKNPERVQMQLPGGNKVEGHMNPASPFAPEGTPGTFTPVITSQTTGGTPIVPNGTPVVTSLAPDVVEGREELTKGLFGKDTDSYVAANNTQGWLNQINHAAEVMNKAGSAYQTGPFAPQRLNLMGAINDAGRTLNLGQPFDTTALSSAEEMRKATTTAGFELSSHYEGHARQAAATIMNATSAVPGMANSPKGITLVSNGINEGAQSAIDMHNYKMARYQGQDPYGIAPDQQGKSGGSGLESAEADYVKSFPAAMYSNRAISTVMPFKITSTDQNVAMKEMGQYLPGTIVVLPNGRQTMVPPRPNAPPIPNYMRGYLQQAPNGG